MMLGTDTVKALVLSVKIFSEFSQKNFAWFNINGLFNHSLWVSMYAKTIIKNENLSESTLYFSMMAGLLHDLGKLILATSVVQLFLSFLLY